MNFSFEISRADCTLKLVIFVQLQCFFQRCTSRWGNGAGLPRSGKNVWKMNFFQAGEKSGNFVDDLGNLERTWKVREKSGNLKINGYGSLQKIYLLCSKGERMYFLMG